MRRKIAALSAALYAGTLVVPTTATASAPGGRPAGTSATSAADDVVVIAVVDSGFSPYNYNFRASQLPQHLDADPANDLPLSADPSTWLPGYTTAGTASFGAIDLTLEDDPFAVIDELEEIDQPDAQLPDSGPDDVHLRWIPGTKIVGAVNFGGNSGFFATNSTHGNGSASVSAGNQHGSCPECVVVLVRYGSGAEREAASNWVMQQDWIDVVTNSFGFSTVMRDRIYDGADTDLQRTASERGQTIFFSSGNGQANTFTAPNTTIQSSQEGPDWIVTVGASAPNGANYTGAGKPVDIASMGSGYEAGYGGDEVNGSGTFGGTSNATPVTAGTYARALWQLRTHLDGPSRAQSGGVVATGPAGCGPLVTDCATADGQVTARELRDGLLHSVTRTPQGFASAGLVGGAPALPVLSDEHEFATEGHGTLFGRINGDDGWLTEVDRVWEPLAGLQERVERTADEQAWFIADSYCRQQVHGTWAGGYWVEDETELPAMDTNWPIRSLLASDVCTEGFGLLKALG